MNAKQISERTPTCGSCHCGTGIGFEQRLSAFRDHNLCGPCSEAWKVLDRLFQGELQRDATWQEFLHEKKCPLCPSGFPVAEKVKGR